MPDGVSTHASKPGQASGPVADYCRDRPLFNGPTQSTPMPNSESNARNIYITRQPILDLKGQVFGYELLYRAVADESASEKSTESDRASSRVLADGVLRLGLDALTGGKVAFVKFSR